MRRPGTKEPRCGLTNTSLELSWQQGAPHVTPPKSVSSALRWQITQKCLRLPLLQCLLPPTQVGPLLLDPGQLQIKCKIHRTRTHYNTHFLRAPYFFLHAYGPFVKPTKHNTTLQNMGVLSTCIWTWWKFLLMQQTREAVSQDGLLSIAEAATRLRQHSTSFDKLQTPDDNVAADTMLIPTAEHYKSNAQQGRAQAAQHQDVHKPILFFRHAREARGKLSYPKHRQRPLNSIGPHSTVRKALLPIRTPPRGVAGN